MCKKRNGALFTGNMNFNMMSTYFPLSAIHNSTPNSTERSQLPYKLQITQELKQNDFVKKCDFYKQFLRLGIQDIGEFFSNNRVFTGVFTRPRAACED